MWCSTLGCIVTLILSLLAAPLAVEAQPAAKCPGLGCSRRIPRFITLSPSGRDCATLDTWKARTSSWNIVLRSGKTNGSRRSRPSWSNSPWMSS